MTRIRTRAILFDMDGTLADSGDGVVEAWRIFAERHSLAVEPFLERCHGRRTEEVLYELAPELDRPAAIAEVEGILADLGASPTPGAAELLASLPRGSWAVVTSSTAPLARSRFQPPTGLPSPGVLVTAEAVAWGKPRPEGYQLAAMMSGVPDGECLVVEDAPAGVAAGKAAGMAVIAVLTTHSKADLAGADYFVNDPTGITLHAAEKSGSGWLLTLDLVTV